MEPQPFDRHAVTAFRYVGWHHNPSSGEVVLRYALDDLCLQEIYSFPVPAEPLSPARRAVVDRLLGHLFLAAGISYYKCAAPDRVVVEAGSFSAADLAYHRLLLAKGLGEFSWANGLDPDLAPHYDLGPGVLRADPPLVTGLNLESGPLVPVGGGKDSCVTIEALRPREPTLITVNRYPVMQQVIDAAARPDLLIRRTLDPHLDALNRSGALNGHVPVTAIVSLACLVAATLQGHDAVVMSNERSASEGNVTYRGVEINHQWSKSAEAEAGLRAVLARITRELEWFSLLRPLSELAIVSRFAATARRYFDAFSSCNAAFRLDPHRRVSRWCGHCPKCQFVWLALATQLSPTELTGIFGHDVFETSAHDGFAALLGLAEWKPFECVGEAAECRVALRLVSEAAAWRDHRVVVALAGAVRAANLWPSDGDVVAAFAVTIAPPGDAAAIPARYRDLVPA